MEATCRVCPFCGQPMNFCSEFPMIALAPGPLMMLRLLWRFKGQIVHYESLRSNKPVVLQFAHMIRMALECAELPWRLDNERDVGYRLSRII